MDGSNGMSVKNVRNSHNPINHTKHQSNQNWVKRIKGERWSGLPQKKTSPFSLHLWHSIHALSLSVSSLCCPRSALMPALPLSWPVSFPSFPVFPLSSLSPSKQACPEHWGTSVLWLRKKMRTAKNFPATHCCDFVCMSMNTYMLCVFSPPSVTFPCRKRPW